MTAVEITLTMLARTFGAMSNALARLPGKNRRRETVHRLIAAAIASSAQGFQGTRYINRSTVTLSNDTLT